MNIDDLPPLPPRNDKIHIFAVDYETLAYIVNGKGGRFELNNHSTEQRELFGTLVSFAWSMEARLAIFQTPFKDMDRANEISIKWLEWSKLSPIK